MARKLKIWGEHLLSPLKWRLIFYHIPYKIKCLFMPQCSSRYSHARSLQYDS